MSEEAKRLIGACGRGALEEVEALLARDPGLAQERQALMRAAAGGYPGVVAALLACGAAADEVDARKGLRRPLLQCLSPSGEKHAGHVEAARLLLEAGADVAAAGQFQGLPPLRVAAAAGYGPLVELLLEAGAPLDIHGAAALYDLEALVRLLEEAPGRARALDALGRQPLHALAASRHHRASAEAAGRAVEAARVLVEAGAEVDAAQAMEGKYQGSPLWWAVSYGKHHGLIGWLLAQGASPQASLIAAAYQGDEESLELLWAAGAEVNARDVHGQTALQHVLVFKRPAAVGWLLAHGADVSLCTEKGHRALHLAALFGHEEEVLRQLLEAGAALEAVDGEGRRAVELARGAGKEAAASFLAARERVS